MPVWKDLPSRLELATRSLERRLFGTASKPIGARTGSPLSRVRRGTKALAIAASLFFLGGFLYCVIYYQSTAQQIIAQPLVRNLVKDNFAGRVWFGRSPACGADLHPCWIEPGFPDEQWETVRLPLDPSTNIKSLKGYDAGLATNSMYYRLRVPVSAELRQSSAEISFSPLSIQHYFYEIYLNGRHVYSSNGRGVLGQLVNLPIQRSDVVDGYASVAIHASVRPEDVGLAHYREILVGPKAALDVAYVYQERTFYTYYLLFLLSKGSVFVIFALFLVYTRGQRGMQYFLVYAFFTTLENLFVGEFLGETLSLRVRALLFHGSKTLSSIGLAGFFLAYFRIKGARRRYLAISALALAVTGLMCLDFGWGSRTVGFSGLRLVNRLFLLATLGFALFVGTLARRLWRRVDQGSERHRNLRNFCWLLGAFLCFDLWEYFFTDFGGFDKSAVLDLFLFYFIALISARDFGTKEGRIETLEGHMAEKHRMEVELQSAAEIARAFLPDSVPTWEPFEIDVFHRPLTENSGDWFAFERSGDGQLYHFIMCDITGHGVQAAIVVSTCKTLLSSFELTTPRSLDSRDFIVQFAKALNATLYQNGRGAHVSTLLGVSFEPATRQLHYFSAGHPLPLQIVRRATGEVTPKALVARHNLLGIAPDYEGRMRQVTFEPGDELITYTDGLPAASHVKVLKAFLNNRSTPGLRNVALMLYQTIWEAETAKTSQPPNDDVSIVWFRAA